MSLFWRFIALHSYLAKINFNWLIFSWILCWPSWRQRMVGELVVFLHLLFTLNSLYYLDSGRKEAFECFPVLFTERASFFVLNTFTATDISGLYKIIALLGRWVIIVFQAMVASYISVAVFLIFQVHFLKISNFLFFEYFFFNLKSFVVTDFA